MREIFRLTRKGSEFRSAEKYVYRLEKLGICLTSTTIFQNILILLQ